MSHSTQVDGKSVLFFRAGLSGIFIVAGISHLINPNQVEKRILEAPLGWLAEYFGDPYILGLLSGITLLLFGITFLLGIYVKWSAAILFSVLVPITITIQLGHGILFGPLWKNIALLSGLIFFILNNPNSYSFYTKK